MHYYPRLKIFKSSTGRNKFDGVEAYSYGWYKYAHVLLSGDVIEVSKAYSNTTANHMHEFRRLFGYDKTYHEILAPRGLGDLDRAREDIRYCIEALNTELANPRNRARDRRIAEIAKLEAMFPIIAMLEADIEARRQAAREVA